MNNPGTSYDYYDYKEKRKTVSRTYMVSVIVPIYNVEDYVKLCLDSLVAQTLENVEFILIDDGSTDNSGKIADQYSSDPRFRIFHTENKGLSAARNYGIDQSCGEYLMFVDGDDWVAQDFCRIPYETAIANNTDLVIFKAFDEKMGKTRTHKQLTNNITGSIDFYTAFEYGRAAAWNKLYKKELFNNIRYPEGRVYEDIATTYKVEYTSKHIVQIDNYLYYHVNRKDSITHKHTSNGLADWLTSAIEQYEDMTAYGYPEYKLKPCIWYAAIVYLIHIKPCKEPLYLQAKQIVESIKGLPKQISKKQRLVLLIWRINPNLFYILCRLFGRIVG